MKEKNRSLDSLASMFAFLVSGGIREESFEQIEHRPRLIVRHHVPGISDRREYESILIGGFDVASDLRVVLVHLPDLACRSTKFVGALPWQLRDPFHRERCSNDNIQLPIVDHHAVIGIGDGGDLPSHALHLDEEWNDGRVERASYDVIDQHHFYDVALAAVGGVTDVDLFAPF